jgi:hypothetical protein
VIPWQGIEHVERDHVADERQRHAGDRGVARVERDDPVAKRPERDGGRRGDDQADAQARERRRARAQQVPGADRLRRHRRGRHRERERDLIAQGGEVHHDLVPAHHGRSQPCDQQRHERERRRLERVGQPHRDAETKLVLQCRPAWPREADGETPVRGVESDVSPPDEEHRPVHDRRGHRAADRAEPWEAKVAEDEEPAE